MEAPLGMSQTLSRRLAAAALAVLIAAAASLLPRTAAAQTTLTAYMGYMGSDGLYDATTDASVSIKSTGMFALAAGYVLDSGREVQLMYAQQATTLEPDGGVAPFDMTVRYLHLGGTVFFDGPIGTKPTQHGGYVVGGLGLTQFSPSLTGYDSAVRPSMNLGLGYYWPLTENVALRAEGRVFITLVNSSGDFLCAGGCVVALKSDFIAQYAAMLGVTGRF